MTLATEHTPIVKALLSHLSAEGGTSLSTAISSTVSLAEEDLAKAKALCRANGLAEPNGRRGLVAAWQITKAGISFLNAV